MVLNKKHKNKVDLLLPAFQSPGKHKIKITILQLQIRSIKY
jgi:hypothetical protein